MTNYGRHADIVRQLLLFILITYSIDNGHWPVAVANPLSAPAPYRPG